MNTEFDNIFNDIFSDITAYTKKLTLLYVEDDAMARDSSLVLFKEFFDNIIIAVDGEDGVEKYNNNNIDIVISDINMPKMDGLLMFEKIRQKDTHTHLILLTAYNDLEHYERSIKLDIEALLLKPINLAPLLSILDKIVSIIKLQEEASKNLHLLQQYQNAMDENLIVSKTDIYGNITYVNNRFINTYGYTKDELLGNTHSILKSDKNPPEVFNEIWDTIAQKKKTWCGLIGNKTKDGKISYSKTTISPILDTNNNPIEYIALRQDVTELI